MKLTVEQTFDVTAANSGVRDNFTEEYRFHPLRKWRFDRADVKRKVAFEFEGAVWTGGRHTRGPGFIKDCEKYNQATTLGWRVFRLATPEQAAEGVKQYLELTHANR